MDVTMEVDKLAEVWAGRGCWAAPLDDDFEEIFDSCADPENRCINV
jgi:hypothetical protein